MNRYELEHLIRAATGIIDRSEIVVIGSQAILGAHPEASAPLTDSVEADLFSRHEPELTDAIDGAIGEGSTFHATFGYYAHGVAEETATLPAAWKDRLVPVRNENTRGAIGWCLEPHDLAVSKLAAGREKDLVFVGALLRQRFVNIEIVRERLAATAFASDSERQMAEARLDRLARENA